MTTDDPKKQAQQQQQQQYPQEKDCSPPIESFRVVASAVDGAGHSIAITSEGWVYTWGRTNGLGQLGRPGKARTRGAAQFADPNENEDDHSKTTRKNVKVKATRAFVGGTSDAGHSAVIDSDGHVWLTGCDRWQQLGLGSSSGGASGYTWKNGALWQERFQKNHFLPDLMRRHACDSTGRNNTMSTSNSDNGTHHRTLIRDMALGGDHTLVLSSNQRDVFAFGNGGDGQLGLKTGKPFVSAPVRSPHLSSKESDPNTRPIAAVCAIRHCSLTLDQHGNVLEKAGKCRHLANGFAEALASCQDRAEREGLIKMSKEKE